MKKLIMISGTMGAGKTSVCIELQKFLSENVFLDGDWCWKAEPFVVNDETKEMVMKNIAFLLAQFLSCSAYQNVIFCWVMDHQEIIDELVARVEEQTEEPFEVHGFTLTLTPEALKERIGKDIESGLRKSDAVNRSVERLTLYETVETEKIDVSTISAGKAAEKISAAVCPGKAFF